MSIDDCRVEDLRSIVEEQTKIEDYPFAQSISKNVLIYDCKSLETIIRSIDGRRELMCEIGRALLSGPGVLAFRGAFTNLDVIDRASEVFRKIIDEQNSRGEATGDHYAEPGANDRVWNSLEKLAIRDPGCFVEYFSNEIISLVASAWLGPLYQVTTQVNVVNPGGAAQEPHRDYHLGFMSDGNAALFPRHVHDLSPTLTLQGAVAHTDMPIETGPTSYLPHSHKYQLGYVAWQLPEFREYIRSNFIQIELQRGDASFFNPAVFHAAGTNQSHNVRRMANLFQVSSAFGRSIETVDRDRVVRAIYPTMRRCKKEGMADRLILNTIAASAEGYAFPTNLDLDPPLTGLVPPTQAEILARALEADVVPDVLGAELDAHRKRRLSQRS